MSNFANINKGDIITVIMKDGKPNLTGEFVSVNSKGVNVKVDGKVVSRSINAVIDVKTEGSDVNTPADLFDNDATYTASTLAAILDMTAKDLRVALRSMNLNVGKGQRYVFDATQARTIAASLIPADDNA